jgi:hypothetical protein
VLESITTQTKKVTNYGPNGNPLYEVTFKDEKKKPKKVK